MKTLYFDLFAGCSGDMILGALVDLGADFDYISDQLATLPVDGYTLECRQVLKNGISATRVHVHLDDESPATSTPEPHGGHSHDHHPSHDHGDDHHLPPDRQSAPSPPHHHSPGGHHHPHRTFRDIRQLLLESSLPRPAVERALAIFGHLAEAEGRIHGRPADDVAFHEVGAVDSIVDITGICLAIESIGLERFACSAVNVGSGTIQCAHGLLPVPAPATAELLRDFPVFSGPVTGEFTTPTGAAVLRTLVEHPGQMPAGVLKATAFGAGSRDVQGVPNVLRLLLLETSAATPDSGHVAVLECNLDDMNPELIGAVARDLLEDGALDVFLTPVQVKKFRPGTLLTVICRPSQVEHFATRLLERTTTFGLRHSTWERQELERKAVSLSTRLGEVAAKAGLRHGRLLKVSPEYESCLALARQSGCDPAEVYREAELAIRHQWAELSDRLGKETAE